MAVSLLSLVLVLAAQDSVRAAPPDTLAAARDTIAVAPDTTEVPRLVREGMVPGGSRRNLEALADFVRWSGGIDESTRLILADAQTSGGLLISLPAERAVRLLDELRERGTHGAIVGDVVAGTGVEVVE